MTNKATLAGVSVGDGHPVKIMGVINVSPESFYGGSIQDKNSISRVARQMERDGADFIDVGAMSTAPYLKTQISENEEAERLMWAVRLIRKACRLPISIDTARAQPAEAALQAGGDIINDVTGLRRDKNLVRVAKKAKGLILMAYPDGTRGQDPGKHVLQLLRQSVSVARKHVPLSRIVLDPGIGFFRDQRWPWWKWDIEVLKDLGRLRTLGRPLLVGVSRKSFIGKILNQPSAEKRLFGSLGATAVAIQNGAHIIRTHDVGPTKELVRMLEELRS